MSEQRIIHTADLSTIERILKSLDNNISTVSHQVEYAAQEINQTQSKLQQLMQDFYTFVQKDMLDKNLQLAKTGLVETRQKLQEQFGHYSEVRRRTTGILQAVDAHLVKKETIEDTTEEHMLAAPRYWLAPCLIALASWLNDNKELAERAMKEALRRDAEKTSLFFALVSRRGARYKASRSWIERYFSLQDPHSLEREIVVLIDGFANGIFGPDARIKCGKQIEQWVDELAEEPGFLEEQLQQWKNALEIKMRNLDENEYPYLRQYSPTWDTLERALAGARLHSTIYEYFSNIFEKEVTPSESIAVAVDALLDSLVSSFDEEELPLKREERLLQLIIEENGDKDRANARFNVEKSIEERVPFTQLLTNFAMYPETSHASIATQKFSIALSKDWIKNAHDDITGENHASVPVDIQVSIDSWTGETTDGSNEQDLKNSMNRHYDQLKNKAMEAVKLGVKHYASVIGTGLLLLLALFQQSILLFLLGIAGAVYFVIGYISLGKKKEQIEINFNQVKEQNEKILRATLAEVVDWRKEYEKQDQNTEKVTNLLNDISPEQYSFSTYDHARMLKQ
ncbi:hypothetical protein ACIQY5_21530 [Peribacillus frigoritolerans]|uniref:hypothetical protein n=1 Tax=Peribacillus frigoritolerans TaxID=450367 RepID=UPI00381D4C8C